MLTIEPRPSRRHRAADDLAAQKRPLDVDVHHRVERSLRVLLERTDLLGRRVGRRVEPGVVDEQVRDAPLGDDFVERVCDRRAIRDVDRECADAVGHGSRCDVEARDAHPSLGEPARGRPARADPPAGHDGDAALEIEERVASRGLAPLRAPDGVAELAHAARTRRRARARASRAERTSGQASAGTTGKPTAARHSASFVSLPRYAVSASETAPHDLLAQDGQLVAMPADALDAELPRARRNRVVRLLREDEVVHSDLVEPSQPEGVAAKQATLSSPRSFVQTRLSVKTPSKSKTTRRISARPVTLRERRRVRGGLDVVRRDGLLRD